jgi:hypothetical protein
VKTKREDFFDMDEEFNTLRSELLDPYTRMVVIKGLRSTGKSSLIRVALNETGLPHILIDLRLAAPPTPETFYEYFSAELSKFLEDGGLRKALSTIKGLEVSGLKLDFSKKKPSVIGRVLEEVGRRNRGRQLVLAIDEAQALIYIRVFGEVLADIPYIVDNVVRLLHPERLPEGVRVLVAAGATIEYMDPIRVVTNQSSGRMGLEIATEAFRRGAEVGLILGHASVNPPSYIPVVRVDDSESLKQALKAQLTEKPPNIYFSTIAVADYRPVRRREAKADTSTENRLHIDLESVGKILPTVKELSPSTVVVAFKAEYRVDEKQLVEKAKRLLDYSDIVYASDVARPEARFGSATTSDVVVDRKGNTITVSNKRKSEVAALLLDLAASMLSMG